MELHIDTATDEDVYRQAFQIKDVIITKDKDFVNLCMAKGAPPKIIWITIGNTTNRQLKEIFQSTFEAAVAKLHAYDIAEISNSI